MGAISVTYTFSNTTPADGTQVNANFTDLVLGLSDGFKTVTIASLISGTGSFSGAATLAGTTTITGKLLAQPLYVGYACNLGISLSGTTLSVNDASGAALSASNYGQVGMASTTAGNVVCLAATANASFTAAQTINMGWGITEAANWANDVPFFLYAVNRSNSSIDGTDGNSAFFIARNPAMSVTPASANNIGDAVAIAATDDQTSILMLGTYTKANYVSLPCQLIGAFRMRWSSATTRWTPQAIGNTDGVGIVHVNKTLATRWQMPTGQMGASSGSFLLANAGTAPAFSSTDYWYKLSITGEVRVQIHANGDGGTDGAGAVRAQLALPFSPKFFGSVRTADTFIGTASGQTTISGQVNIFGSIVEGQAYTEIQYCDISALQTLYITNAMFSNGNRGISGNFTFGAF